MKPTLVILGLLLSGTAHAQLSVRAGGTVSTLATSQNTLDQYAETTAGTGWQFGLVYEKKLPGRWALRPELAYRRQGLEVVVSDNRFIDASYDGRYRLVLHYLSLPVMARVTFGRFYVEGGPYGSFLLAAHEQGIEVFGTNAGAFERAVNRSATDRYRGFDAGLGAGAGAKLPGGLAVGLRASTGLFSVSRTEQVHAYPGSLKNQVLEASLSYRLGPE